MKLIKWMGHPVIFLILYLLLIIEGDQFGGFFMLYLLLALPHLVPYAVIAAVGMACVIVGFNVNKPGRLPLKPILYLAGLCLMLLALVLFFAKGNKWETFQFTLPAISFIIFGLCSFCFLLNIVSLFINSQSFKEIKAVSSK